MLRVLAPISVWRNIGDGVLVVVLLLLMLVNAKNHVQQSTQSAMEAPAVKPADEKTVHLKPQPQIQWVEMRLPAPIASSESKIRQRQSPLNTTALAITTRSRGALAAKEVPPGPLVTPLLPGVLNATEFGPIVDTQQPHHQQQGETLLRQLEQGQGPAIEIAWPATNRDRSRLFRVMYDCLALRVGKLHNGSVSMVEPLSNTHMSGFIRLVSGHIVAEERRRLSQLQEPGEPVRVFPRALDASMLGGLSQLMGPAYHSSRLIRGYYQLVDGQLIIHRISRDGLTVPGVIQLAGANCH